MTEPTEKKARPKRSWLRFSMRGLLLLIFVLAVTMTWLANHWSQHRIEAEIAERIGAAKGIALTYEIGGRFNDQRSEMEQSRRDWIKWAVGDDAFDRIYDVSFFEEAGEFEFLVPELAKLESLENLYIRSEKLSPQSIDITGKLPKLTNLSLHVETLTPEQLRQLSSLKNLKSLELPYEATDEHLAELRHFPKLEELKISGPHITSDGLRALIPITSLRSLEIGNRETLSPMDAQQLAQLTQLESLSLWCDIDEEALAKIAQLTSLQRLWIYSGKGITPEGFAHLATLTSLEHLHFDGVTMDDEMLKTVGKMSALKELVGNGDGITDAGVQHLVGLQDLETLNIGGAQVTLAGLKTLSRARRLNEVHLGGQFSVFLQDPDPQTCGTCALRWDLSTKRKRANINNYFGSSGSGSNHNPFQDSSDIEDPFDPTGADDPFAPYPESDNPFAVSPATGKADAPPTDEPASP